jgi:hypothetical protein
MIPPMPRVSPIVCLRPYLFGISKSVNGAGSVAADLEHGEHEVGAVEGAGAIGGGLDGGGGSELPGDAATHDVGCVEALGVDVVEDDGGVSQLGEAQDVAEQLLRKDSAAGADERDLGHSASPTTPWHFEDARD